ncbi:MAG: T9SS type A sorting domain-containing protein [Chitinophagales bacterium]|nr:T9SS type A sorting domain-containing protein [Chitinophagales bacterium]
MKKLCSTLLLLLYVLISNAQMKYWTFSNKKIDFTGVNPTLSTISSMPTFPQINHTNAVYDETGNLLFYIDNGQENGQWYKMIYNASGVVVAKVPRICAINPPSSCTVPNYGPIFLIVPEDGTCRKYKIFYTLNIYICGSYSSLYMLSIDCSDPNNIVTSYSTTTQMNPCNGEFDVPQSLTSSSGSYPGLTATKLIGNDRYIYFVTRSIIETFKLTSGNITKISTYNIPENHPSLTELEYFNNGTNKFISWVHSDNGYKLCKATLGTSETPTSYSSFALNYSGLMNVSGFEIDPTNPDFAYISTNLGIFKQHLSNASNYTLLANSQNYSKTNLEIAKDGFIYAINNSGTLGKINLTTSTIQASSLSLTIDETSNLNPSSLSGYQLPNQIDGDNYTFFPNLPALVTISNFTINNTTLSTNCASLTNINNFTPVQFNATTSGTPSQYRFEIKSLDASCNPVTGSGKINYSGSWINGTPPANLDISTLIDGAGLSLRNVTGKVKITYFVRNACNVAQGLSKNINLLPPPTSMTISGVNCNNGSSYTISGIPANSFVIWSASPAGIVSINPNGNSCTLTQIGYGVITLTATLGNTTATKVITVGLPYTLYPANPNLPEAVMETGMDEGPCNSQCYSPGGPSITWNTPIAYNATGVTWQKLWSLPANYAFWSGNTNSMTLLFKAANQSVEFKRTITNGCGSIYEYYCFGSTTTLCGARLQQTPQTVGQIKLYPNPVISGNELAFEILDKTILETEGNLEYELIDIHDNLLLNSTLLNQPIGIIKIPKVAAGIYFLRIKVGEKTIVEEIVVQ